MTGAISKCSNFLTERLAVGIALQNSESGPRLGGAARKPAAMNAGVVDTLWSFEELFDRVMGGSYAIAA